MLKLRYDTADWRDALASVIDSVEHELKVEHEASCYDNLADELCSIVLSKLLQANVKYKQAYQQSKSAFAIVQEGVPEELEAFDMAVDEALKEIEPEVRKHAKWLAER